ncbi:hypothetical protein C6P42_003108 [Pichia californica]|nr:hypothetical protein C6P42_003108 [[Candida] californica]
MTRIVIVGSGVLGITNAYNLLKENPLNEVTIVSQNFPTDFEFKKVYTSPIAGANWESFATSDDKFVQEIDTVGYRKYQEFIKNRPEAGVTARKNTNLITKEAFAKAGNVKEIPWFGKGKFGIECGFRELNKSEFDNEKFAYGFTFNGLVIRTSYYMTFLINECWRLSGASEGPNARFSIRRNSIKKLSQAFELHSSGKRADIVINCTGLLARELEDLEPEEKKKIYPVRGVVFVAKNNTGLKDITVVELDLDDEALYIMPRREGELIIGGCFQKGVETKYVDDALRTRILGRCAHYLPQYKWDDLEIVREQVGFRPYREGGYRIERKGHIVHCYGVGGAGFQSSWGCVEKVANLVAEVENSCKL